MTASAAGAETGHSTGRAAVTAVVLDIGNVVLAWEPVAAVAGRVGLRQWEEFVVGADFAGLNARSDAGEPFETIVAELAAAHPRRPDWVEILRTYRRHHTDSLPGPVPGAPELIEDLVTRGVAVYALTNFDAEPFEAARRRFPVLERFAGVVVSGREHLVKPDPAIFTVLLERFGLDAERTLFVDDSPANTRAAAALGLQVHLFTGIGRLRAELCEHGLLRAPVD
ncbi:MAG: HAD family phosphatase [Actinomyces sp.]|nr:HAD family phosphatase [Actinomyces sp.]MDO4243279.1 HAD family phosphatase [Actinomyces sp.]